MVYITLTKDHKGEVVGPGNTPWLLNSHLHFHRGWRIQRLWCRSSQDGDQSSSKTSNTVTGSEILHRHCFNGIIPLSGHRTSYYQELEELMSWLKRGIRVTASAG